MIFCTHREIYVRRPGWRDTNPDCTGRLIVEDDTAAIWTADCDGPGCGLTIGIPPREQRKWRETARTDAAEAVPF